MTTHPRPDTVLFDLDGTLIDSGPSILAALRKAFAEEGVPALPPAAERSLLGPPLYRALPPLVGDASDRVVRTYRRIFVAEGFAYQAKAYPGIEALLDGLARHHVRLAVSTSKLETSARAILEHLGLAGRFATICGDTQDAGRPTKAEVIAETLRRIGESPRRTGESSADDDGRRPQPRRHRRARAGAAVPGCGLGLRVARRTGDGRGAGDPARPGRPGRHLAAGLTPVRVR